VWGSITFKLEAKLKKKARDAWDKPRRKFLTFDGVALDLSPALPA